jgi:hypothetical protein
VSQRLRLRAGGGAERRCDRAVRAARLRERVGASKAWQAPNDAHPGSTSRVNRRGQCAAAGKHPLPYTGGVARSAEAGDKYADLTRAFTRRARPTKLDLSAADRQRIRPPNLGRGIVRLHAHALPPLDNQQRGNSEEEEKNNRHDLKLPRDRPGADQMASIPAARTGGPSLRANLSFIVNSNVVPAPGALVTDKSPPRRCASVFVIERPRSAPP